MSEFGGMPHSPEAERAVLGRIMANGHKLAGQVVGTLLEPTHFFSPGNRLIYEAIYEAYYADEPMDALTIAEMQSKKLARLWDTTEDDAIIRVRDMADGQTFSGAVTDHARIIKRDSDYRLLLGLAKSITEAVSDEEQSPEEIGGIASQRAMRIATNTLLTHELSNFGDLGREFIREAEQMMQARQQGIELGAYFDMIFVDDFIHGLQPTELWVFAGDPGAGKTAVSWAASLNFARRQLQQPEERRIGTLVLSLEMGALPSKMRIAQTLTGIDSGRMRDGTMSALDLQQITNAWGRERDLPIYFNFTSSMKASQMRAVISESIRRYNVGLVVIDHFRHFRMDQRYERQIQEDEDKVLFLKESIAKDLNVAVICLAHTTKFSEQNHNRRPALSNLRGSGQVAATADFVSFIFRPFDHATDEEKSDGTVRETDAEMIWAKNRFGVDATTSFYFEPRKMLIK